MTDWIAQYSAALDIRDAREKAHKPYIDAYTRLADRTAATATTTPSSAPTTAPVPPARTTSTPAREPKNTTPPSAAAATPDPPSSSLLTTLRHDLHTTQKARGALQQRLDSLTASLARLQTDSQTSAAQVAALTRQKADAERRLRDREDEVREKGKLAEAAQDEMVSLQLQLSMAEQRSERLQRENEELVARWMQRMGEEADKVNRESKWQ